MSRQANSYARKPAKLRVQPRILVICEDSKSSKNYLEDVTYHFRINVLIHITHCGSTDPRGIVHEAIAKLKEFDTVFCVIDRDTHENFDEALRLAKTSERVKIITSYPCFEFWYLIHFGFTRRSYTRAGKKSAGDCVVDALRACEGMAGYAKGGSKQSVFSDLLGKLPDARRLSAAVLAQAHADGNLNPSTQVHELIECFETLSVPQQI